MRQAANSHCLQMKMKMVMTKQWLYLPFDSSLFSDITRDSRHESNTHENENKHRPCRFILTLFVQHSRKWKTVILCIRCLVLDCSCKNVHGCHELVIFSIFFFNSYSLGINQSEVGFHLLCCDKRQCQNQSYLLLFSIRLRYKLCNQTEKDYLSPCH